MSNGRLIFIGCVCGITGLWLGVEAAFHAWAWWTASLLNGLVALTLWGLTSPRLWR